MARIRKPRRVSPFVRVLFLAKVLSFLSSLILFRYSERDASLQTLMVHGERRTSRDWFLPFFGKNLRNLIDLTRIYDQGLCDLGV